MDRHLTILLLGMVVAIGPSCGGGSGSSAQSGCEQASDCGAGRVCQEGLCVSVCSSDSHCPVNQVCRDSMCQATVCGDGAVEGLEQCDNGVSNADSGACTSECKLGVCGDGLVLAGSEACDDANTVNDDGCDNNCTPTGCGNGIVTTGEQCDDGNLIDFDGCNADCSYTDCTPTTPDNTPCEDDGIFCNGPELCIGGACVSSGNPCEEDGLSCTTVLCDEETRRCNVLDAGYCLVDGACYSDAAVNPSVACQYCDAADSSTHWETVEGYCLIDGTCYTNMERDSNDPCSYCDVVASTDEWQSFGHDLTYDGGPDDADRGDQVGDDCGAGACEGGVVVCSSSDMSSLICTTADYAATESCNLNDDDCDGQTDEDFWEDAGGDGLDLPDSWSFFNPVLGSFPVSSTGTVEGHILPMADVDSFRIYAEETTSFCVTNDEKIKANLTLTVEDSSLWYAVCLCWSSAESDTSEAARCDKTAEDCVAMNGSGTVSINGFSMDTVCGGGEEDDRGYLDVRVEPVYVEYDFACEDWTLSWQIYEEM